MKIIYMDCSNGISGDMVRGVFDYFCDSDCSYSGHNHVGYNHSSHNHTDHVQGDNNGHGRSLKDVIDIIKQADIPDMAKEYAINIYTVIGTAESKVHKSTLETVHFHEVGRDEAIENIINVSLAMENIRPDVICCSTINDGRGYIECSHGKIAVPVPAVKAMMSQCSLTFDQVDVDTEMVTPSGLATLIGLNCKHVDSVPDGSVMDQVEIKGKKDIGLGGLKAYLIKS